MIEFAIKIDCETSEKAARINEALRIDNERYIRSYVEGKYIIAEGMGNAMSVIHTINDFFSCLQMALQL